MPLDQVLIMWYISLGVSLDQCLWRSFIMLEPSISLEVLITKKEGAFLATCPSFPKCKGAGETELLALEKLSSSIGRAIGRSTSTVLKKAFLSDNYAQIITTPDNKSTQHRIFKLPAHQAQNDHNVPEKSEKEIYFKFDNLIQKKQASPLEAREILSYIESTNPDSNHSHTSDPSQLKSLEFLLGVKLSLN